MSPLLLNTVKQFIPSGARPALRSVRRVLRRVYYLPVDLISGLRGRNALVPPPSLLFVGDGDFLATGEEFKGYFVSLGSLKPDDRVLDVGCGVGRIAVGLTGYLSGGGSYEGFDIVPEGIEWCQRVITPRFPGFHFQVADIYNRGYNPHGKFRACEYRFPFEDGAFDFMLSTSVFTHLLPEDVEHYLAETSRVLKPGGRCLITFFLVNGESSALIESGSSSLDFRYSHGQALTIDRDVPENAVAYRENDIRASFCRVGLQLTEPIRYGRWCGRKEFLSYQDIVTARKMEP